jgi:DNA modification methylase
MEIDPQYCQVAIDRWEAFTGQRATKVGDAVRA